LTDTIQEVIVEEVANTRRGKREKGGQPMSEENKAIVRREVEELFNHTGTLDAAEEVYGPDFVGHDPTMPEDIHGIEEARQFAAGFRSAFPDLTCTIEDQVAEGDKVVTRWRTSGTHQGQTEELGPPTGNRMEMTGISIERISEGKVVESWDNYDAMGMMQQLGHIPSPEEAQA
jgi:steroid delta-isomerase-like uncharacterized protein